MGPNQLLYVRNAHPAFGIGPINITIPKSGNQILRPQKQKLPSSRSGGNGRERKAKQRHSHVVV